MLKFSVFSAFAISILLPHCLGLPSFTDQAVVDTPSTHSDLVNVDEEEDHSAFDVQFIKATAPPSISTMPSSLSQKASVSKLLGLISSEKTLAWMTRLTQFPERYYKSDNGVLAAKWIRDQIVALNGELDPAVNLTVSLYNHPRWKQPSVIARLAQKGESSKKDLVITGSHFDTLARGHPSGEGK
jgi:hypothetical protein